MLIILTHGVLRRGAHPGVLGCGRGALGEEFVEFGGFVEDLVDVDALNGGEAVFDEEGVGLPIGRIGAAVRRREVFHGGQADGRRVEGSCKCQGKQRKEDAQHGDRGM